MMYARINGTDLAPFVDGTLSTPYVFEVTDQLKEVNELTLTCGNSYSG